MKFKSLICMAIIPVLIFCGCSEKEKKGVEVNNTVEELVETGEPERLYFDNYYAGSNGGLWYYDKEKKQGYPLCFKPSCNHDDEQCDSAFNGIIESVTEDDENLYCVITGLDDTRIEMCKKDGTNHKVLLTRDQTYYIPPEIAINSGYLFASYSYMNPKELESHAGCVAINLKTFEETNFYEKTEYNASCSVSNMCDGFLKLTTFGRSEITDELNVFSYKLKQIDCSTLEVSDITDDLWGYQKNVVDTFFENPGELGLLVKNGENYNIHLFNLKDNKEIETVENLKVDTSLLRYVMHVQGKYVFVYNDLTSTYYDSATKEYKELKVNKDKIHYLNMQKITDEGLVIEFVDSETYESVIKFVDFDTFFNVDYFGD
ncbi:MAG: hypothetical protein K6G26_05595 [Lachnospiraceae bacterium]|nr:hypothetical protein [Lachnospiraceae bacterium]